MPRQKNRRLPICDRARKIIATVHLTKKSSTSSSVEKSRFTVLLEGWLHLTVHMGDITEEKVEAITNAANS